MAAVPHDVCLGRAFHPNKKLITLTDQLFPRGSPPLRPLTNEELVRCACPVDLRRGWVITRALTQVCVCVCHVCCRWHHYRQKKRRLP